MTCAQGLLRLLWGGGPEVGVLRDCTYCLGYGNDISLLQQMFERKSERVILLQT